MEMIGRELASDADALPGVVSLAEGAGPVAAHARPLLAASRAVLLSLTIATGTERSAPVAMCWAVFAQPIPLRATLVPFTRRLARSLAKFEEDGQRLLRSLMVGWPVNALPPALGIVTDGDGVVFSSDHPSPLRPDWLALHQAGLCAPTALLPFSRPGTWARLTDAIAARHLH